MSFLPAQAFYSNLAHFLSPYHVIISNVHVCSYTGTISQRARTCTENGFACTKCRVQKIILMKAWKLYYILVSWFSGNVGKSMSWKIKKGSHFPNHNNIISNLTKFILNLSETIISFLAVKFFRKKFHQMFLRVINTSLNHSRVILVKKARNAPYTTCKTPLASS